MAFIIGFCIESSCSSSINVEPNPNVMLGMYMVQYAELAWNLDMGALTTPFANRLLLVRLSSNWALVDPVGAGHMPRVRCALEQSRCSILFGIGSRPEVRDTRSSPMFDADSSRGVPSGSKR